MSTSDLWHVKLSEGCVVEMTLDEIDTAFNAGRIKASTSVLAPGDFRWTTLGEAAGLEDEPEPAPYSIAPVAADVTPPPPLVDEAAPVGSGRGAARPRRRGVVGRVASVSALFAVLVAAGMAGGAYAAGPAEFKARVSSLRERLTHAPAGAAAVAAPPPGEAAPPPPVTAAPLREAPAPVAAPVAPSPAPQPSLTTAASVAVDSLPDAKAVKSKKAAAPRTKRK